MTGIEFTGMATNLTVDVAGDELMVSVVDAPDGIKIDDQVGLLLAPHRLWVVKP
ncbi:TOBE domain-containing protein [Catellatospora bangladeshensis]|uniref:TOBE domain-containing protein n=1 Tax=Catellatospora bangladeshensis TaxID=310355 RepID=UPI0036237659